VNKPLRIAPWVVAQDLQSIYDYHRLFSLPKAERILAEYERVIAALEVNPLLLHERANGWRIYPFAEGTYLLYYRELPAFWLVVAIFHARREPDWIRARLNERIPAPVS
jgi:plasmid stabilization system protein ParE